jgi:S1-C subfamily serine protease
MLAALIAGLVLLTAGIGIGWDLTRDNGGVSSTATQAPIQTRPSPLPTDLNLQAIASKVDPAVVDVDTIINGFGGSGGVFSSEASGTGMVLTSSGEVLTNNHVVAGSTSITVTVVGRSGKYSATVVGADPKDDVALLQIQGVSGLPTVSLADSSGLAVGQRVAAIGNALGRGGTPTISGGSVSALGETISVSNGHGGAKELVNLIQTDASVSPGESGGPLVNSAGQVVGMITAAARVRPSNPVSRVSYAIPVNTAIGIVNQIRSGQASADIIIGPAGFLGVAVDDVDQAAADRLGLSNASGALVISVVPGTPADQAGITQGSVITAIDGRSVGSVDDLAPAIYVHKPGDQMSVTWVDQGGTHTATVTLISGPAV